MRRRDVLTGALKIGTVLSLSAAPFIVPRRTRAATAITYAGTGGTNEEIVRKYWFEPFTAEAGIAVQFDTGPDKARAKAQVESKQYYWNVYEFSDYEGEKQGLWESIDTKIINPARFIRKPPSWGVPINSAAGSIGYDPSRSKNPPRNFAQFWDVKNFPGRRALRRRVIENLEMALVADGVAPSNLYPLDVDRAFKSLDRIKPHVTRWYATSPEGASLIQTKEVDYAYTYTNRVRVANESGVSISISMDQCIIIPTYNSVLRGSPNKEASMQLLEFITRPEQQISYCNAFGLAPAVKDAYQRLDEKTRRWLPDSEDPKMIFFDWVYWGDHMAALTKRFEEWLLT
ncbi:putative spermidine/putrescine transport system substrate-binding protein [Bradyrhizobium sp. USDA 4516]